MYQAFLIQLIQFGEIVCESRWHYDNRGEEEKRKEGKGEGKLWLPQPKILPIIEGKYTSKRLNFKGKSLPEVLNIKKIACGALRHHNSTKTL